MDDLSPIQQARLHWRDEEPQATDYQDCYFSHQSGSAESRHVFIDGNRLSERFAVLPPRGLFVIGETGFGTGLNFLETASCFLQQAPADAQLYFISCEKHPLSRTDLKRAQRAFPQHAELASSLQDCYPSATPGFHLCCPHPRIRLLLLQGDALSLLSELDAKVDAWFLDGFAPAKNSSLWQPAIYQQLARLSREGATLATFTAVGQVRRDLLAAGFAMQKAEGFGRKRHMLTGQKGGHWQPYALPQPSVAVIGAGLAGCTTAYALAQAGCKVSLFDPQGIAQGASGNLAGVLYTSPSGNLQTQNRFYQSSYLQALRWLKNADWPRNEKQGRLNGMVQLPAKARLAKKLQAGLETGFWPPELLRLNGDSLDAGVTLPEGGYLNPPAWCQQLASHANIRLRPQRLERLEHTADGWQLHDSSGEVLAQADKLVLANAAAAQEFVSTPLRLKLIRGQVTHVAATEASRAYTQAICHNSYFSPAIDGLHCVGASFDLHDPRRVTKEKDDAANLALLKQWLPDVWQSLGGEAIRVHSSRTELRCQSRDFLPLVGAIEQPGLFISVAYGSRGISSTPLTAELLASQLLGTPCPVDRTLAQALEPGRFAQ